MDTISFNLGVVDFSCSPCILIFITDLPKCTIKCLHAYLMQLLKVDYYRFTTQFKINELHRLLKTITFLFTVFKT